MYPARLEKVKRPGGVFWFGLLAVQEDADGAWLWGPGGSVWGAPHDTGTLPVSVVLFLPAGLPWAAWFVADPVDRRLEVDVCLPAERTPTGWRYVDLELDPIRHGDGRVEVEDRDELEDALRGGFVTPAEAALAERTAAELAASLTTADAAWQRQGWAWLVELTGQGD